MEPGSWRTWRPTRGSSVKGASKTRSTLTEAETVYLSTLVAPLDAYLAMRTTQ
jgi:hypothetical protein